MLRRTLDTPWKAWNEAWRWLILPCVRFRFFANGVSWGKRWRIYGLPIIQRHRRSRIVIGDGLQMRSGVRTNPLGPYRPVTLSTRRPGSQLVVGERLAITGGTICADKRIQIGDRVSVGANCIIVDTDFHPIPLDERRANPNVGTAAPVVIEDDVLIGMNSLILKGVRLGKGCVIGAGSVVTRDVPPGAVVAGNPARLVRDGARQ